MSTYTYTGTASEREQQAKNNMLNSGIVDVPTIAIAGEQAIRDAILAEASAAIGGTGAFTDLTVSGSAAIGGALSTSRKLHITGTQIAAGGTANALLLNATLQGTATNDSLTELLVTPSFSPGAVTGLVGRGIRVASFSVASFTSPGDPVGIAVDTITGTGALQAFGIIVAAPSGATTLNIGIFTTIGDRGLNVSGAAVGAATTKYGVISNAIFNTSTTAAGLAGFFQLATAAASFTMTNGIGIQVSAPSIGAGSSVTNLYGVYIGAQTGGGTLNHAWFAETTTNSSSLSQAGLLTIGGGITVTAATGTTAVLTPASVAGASSLRLPHGTAPSAPVNGDVWTTTAGLFVRVNGATVGPLT